jgi:hypothetical protein
MVTKQAVIELEAEISASSGEEGMKLSSKSHSQGRTQSNYDYNPSPLKL